LRGVSSHENINKEGEKSGCGTSKDKDHKGGAVTGMAAVKSENMTE
jgi:hypothetical protein